MRITHLTTIIPCRFAGIFNGIRLPGIKCGELNILCGITYGNKRQPKHLDDHLRYIQGESIMIITWAHVLVRCKTMQTKSTDPTALLLYTHTHFDLAISPLLLIIIPSGVEYVIKSHTSTLILDTYFPDSCCAGLERPYKQTEMCGL